MALLLFIFPGTLLLWSACFNKKDLPQLICYAVGISVAFFTASSLLIKFIGPVMTVFVYLTITASVLLLLLWKNGLTDLHFELDGPDILIVLLMLLTLILRLVPMQIQPLPSGADAARIVNEARLILENDGPSASAAMSNVGAGTLAACISLVGGSPATVSYFFISCFAYAFFGLSLYVILRHLFEKTPAAAAGLLTPFLLGYAQSQFALGGANAVLAASFLIMGVSALIELGDDSKVVVLIISALFLLAAFSSDAGIFWSSRSAILLAVPISAALALALNMLEDFGLLVGAFAVFAAVNYVVFYLYFSVSRCAVTPADIEAFKWIDKTIGSKAVFAVGNSDAGPWIPALTGRGAIASDNGKVPHGADYAFIGQKAIGGSSFDQAKFEAMPGTFRLVYVNDGAEVWKVL